MRHPLHHHPDAEATGGARVPEAVAIPEQVRLPLAIACDVVLQGLRIRFGRSLVTLSGVALGIAFLMSSFTLYHTRRAVSAEQALRAEAQRMVNVLRAELGPPAGRWYRVAGAGPARPADLRFIRALAREGVAGVIWNAGPLPPDLANVRAVVTAPPADAPPPHAEFVIGQATAPQSPAPTRVLLSGTTERPLGSSSQSPAPTRELLAGTTERLLGSSSLSSPPTGGATLSLAQKPDPEAAARLATEQRQARFRTTWILIVALLVTTMGIANAMLMSVTERFREIGTMKCLGARSLFIRQVFLLESALLGLVGGVLGALLGLALPLMIYALIYGAGALFPTLAYGALAVGLLLAVLTGVVLSVLAALYPANVAARMVPAMALRSNV